MAGRPQNPDRRNWQYRVRLNQEEENMLDYSSQITGVKKSEIFRLALQDYYNNVKINNYMREHDIGEWAEQSNGICLERIINCPYCGENNRVDLGESDISQSERQMGVETTYEFDTVRPCDSCGRDFEVFGFIIEYPLGALNYEKINVVREGEK